MEETEQEYTDIAIGHVIAVDDRTPKAALTKKIKHKVGEKGISFPYPQHDVHVIK